MVIALAERRRGPGAPGLVAVARRRFLRGESLDIAGIAEELGVSRATAYRWAGNYEQLIGRVIATLARDTFDLAVQEGRGRGRKRVLDVVSRGLRYMATNEPYRRFIEQDPQRALRIVTSSDGPVVSLMISLNERLLAEEIARGTLKLSLDPHTIAYAIVRISEAFLYADIIAGDNPDIEKAVQVIDLLLR